MRWVDWNEEDKVLRQYDWIREATTFSRILEMKFRSEIGRK